MSRALSSAVVRSGLVTSDALAEIRRWGLPLDIDEGDMEELPESLEAIIGEIRDALAGADMVVVRNTDLDIMRTFLQKGRKGYLAIKGEEIPVRLCELPNGDVAIPWISESVADFLLGMDSYLLIGRRKVYIRDVREVYFGEVKAFMVCTLGTKEQEDD